MYDLYFTMTSVQSPLVPRPILVPFVEAVAFIFGNVNDKSGRHVRTKLDLSFAVIKNEDVKDETKVKKLLSKFIPKIDLENCSFRMWKQDDVEDAFKEIHPSYSVLLTMK